jgi:hypothetical protein
MTAMRAENDIFRFQTCTNSDRNRLLADIRVTRPVNQSALMRTSQLLLAPPDQEHLTVKGQELDLIQSGKLPGLHGGRV